PRSGVLMRIVSWGNLHIVSLNKIFDGRYKKPEVPEYLPKSITNINKLLYNFQVTEIKGLEKWDVSHVVGMNSMFYGAEKFDQDLSSWKTSSVRDMSYMFYTAKKFNANIGSWDVSNVENMTHMFHQAENFNGDIGSWDVSKVKDMSHMFHQAHYFNQD